MESIVEASRPNAMGLLGALSSRRWTRYLGVIATLAAGLLINTPDASGQTTVFGPKTYTRTSGPPNTFNESFAASVTGTFTLVVQNGDADGGHRLSAGSIELNGVEVVFERDFNQQVERIERTVNVLSSNTLMVKLKGGVTDSFIIVSITSAGGGDTTPPVLTIGPANGSIVNTTTPLIEITYDDNASGVDLNTLQTPYAEGFGYRMDAKFLAITIGAHAVYGLVLWLCLSWWGKRGRRAARITAGFLCVPLGLSVMAADFHNRYASALTCSPPPSMSSRSSRAYTTWDVPEPDRIVVMWIMQRFVEPQAEFHFIKPFDRIQDGIPFDLPEADIRRHGIQSASEYLLESKGISSAKLDALARMTHLNEVTPWMLASDLEAGHLTQMLREEADRNCGTALSSECLPKLFAALDQWYDEP